MTDIKIFLGSSIVEFEKERLDISNHIARLNNDYHDRGVFFKLIICENISGAVAIGGKQAEYNREIEDSQYVYILIGNKVGEYTRQEFDVALKHFQQTNSPQIHTFFMRNLQRDDVDESVREFMDYIDNELNHYHNEVDNLDAVKLDLTLELIANPAVGGEVQIENGKAVLNGKEMFSVEALPMYANNESLQGAKRRLDEINARFVALRLAMVEDPTDDGILNELVEVQATRNDLAKQIADMETAVLESCNLVREKGRIGAQLDWREREALELVNQGDFKAANAILRDTLWDAEFEQANDIGDTAVAKCCEYISGKRLLIANLKALGVTAKSEAEIIELYESICASAEKWQVELDVLADYADFLRAQRHYTRAIEVAERCKKRYELAGDVPLADVAHLLHGLGVSYYFAHDDTVSVDVHLKAVALYERLYTEAPALYEPKLIEAYNSLATSYGRLKQQEQREAYLLKAKVLGERLLAADWQGNAPAVASTYNRLAVANNRMNRSDEALAYHLQALELREKLAVGNPDKYEQDLAETLNNLGVLYEKQRQLDKAEQAYSRCIEIRRRRTKTNPSMFETKLALACTNYARLLQGEGRLGEAEKLVREAVEIRRRWSKIDPAGFTTGLAISLDRLGEILAAKGDPAGFDEAERVLREAIGIREELAETAPTTNEPALAIVCESLGSLVARRGRTDEADELFKRAIRLESTYAKGEGTTEDMDLARIHRTYAEVLRGQGRESEAREQLDAARAIYEVLAQKNPEAYAAVLENLPSA